MIGALTMVTMMAVLPRPTPRRLAFVFIGSIGVIIMGALTAPKIIQRFQSAPIQSEQTRGYFNQAVHAMANDHMFGVGLNAYDGVFANTDYYWYVYPEIYDDGAIDLDELNIIYPSQDRPFSRRNLKAIWPNYTVVPDLKVIIPTVIADTADYQSLLDAMPADRVMICELTAPESILKDRVAAREPNAYWQERLRKWVDVYHQRDESQTFGDFQVTTHDKSIDEAAKEVIEKAGWHNFHALRK